MAKEIERKFIITEKPEGFEEIKHGTVLTWYLSVEPEHRLRTKKENGVVLYTETKKSNGTLSRDEYERDISFDDFNRLLKECALFNKPIRSEYWNMVYGDYVLEVMHKDLDGEHPFWVLEVEFNSEEEALSFVLPEAVCGMDVTFVDAYKMKNYWRKTRLKEDIT